jgi:hypothetical protein
VQHLGPPPLSVDAQARTSAPLFALPGPWEVLKPASPVSGVHVMPRLRCLEYDYYFVLEVMREVRVPGKRDKKKKVVHRAYIVEPTRLQFYRTYALHCRWHFLRKGLLAVHTQCTTYEEEFGLEEREPDEVAAAVANDEKVFAFLDNTTNHLLEEIQVVNDADSDDESVALVDAMRLDRLAALVLNDPGQPLATDERGNVRRDIGLAGRSCRAMISALSGMYVPEMGTMYNVKPGLDGDANFTQSMVKTACKQTRFVTRQAQRLGQPQWANDFRGNAERSEHFCRRIGRALGVDDCDNYVTEGNSLGVNADLSDSFSPRLVGHYDTNNGRSEGYDMYWGVVVYVQIRVGGRLVRVRVNFGGYARNHICGVYRRLAVNRQILEEYLRCKRANPERYVVDARVLLRGIPHGSMRYVPPRRTRACTTACTFTACYSSGWHATTTLPSCTRQFLP